VFHYAPKNHPANGGLFIALVGGDGAGKTTMLDDLSGWLSGVFEVSRLHMGKPEWSRTTTAVRAILKIGTLLHLYPFEADVYESTPKAHGFAWFVRAGCTARDRYLTYLRARRASTNGKVVLCDRFSLPGFIEMDGPQCQRALKLKGGTNRFLRLLAEREAAYYRQIRLPDLMIVLKVDPEVAVQRKVDESEVSVRARSTQVFQADWNKLSACVIDASRSKAEISTQVRKLVWEHL
jgi:thymidylate kinase